MTKNKMVAFVKENLGLQDTSKDLLIADRIQDVCSYCNLKEIPEELEPFIRRKVEQILLVERSPANATLYGVTSMKEGDSSITFDNKMDYSSLYGLTEQEKKNLRPYRKLSRGCFS